jgi:prolyl oligopeptidase
VVDSLHGVRVADPYRWLEAEDTPEVRAWTAAQNQLTQTTLAGVPGRQAALARYRQLFGIGSHGVPVARGKGARTRLFYTRRHGDQNQPALYAKDPRGRERVLVDPNTLSQDGTRALDWWFPSQDGRLLAYGLSADGSEESELLVMDVDTGQSLPDRISRTRACSVAWLPDGSGFYYTRYPAPGTVPPGEHTYHRAVYFHRLGTDPDQDPRVFDPADSAMRSRHPSRRGRAGSTSNRRYLGAPSLVST